METDKKIRASLQETPGDVPTFGGNLEHARVEVEPRKLAVQKACFCLDCFCSHQLANPLARCPRVGCKPDSSWLRPDCGQTCSSGCEASVNSRNSPVSR